MVRPGGILIIDHRNYDYILETGRAPQGKNIYYKVLQAKHTQPARPTAAAGVFRVRFHFNVTHRQSCVCCRAISLRTSRPQCCGSTVNLTWSPWTTPSTCQRLPSTIFLKSGRSIYTVVTALGRGGDAHSACLQHPAVSSVRKLFARLETCDATVCKGLWDVSVSPSQRRSGSCLTPALGTILSYPVTLVGPVCDAFMLCLSFTVNSVSPTTLIAWRAFRGWWLRPFMVNCSTRSLEISKRTPQASRRRRATSSTSARRRHESRKKVFVSREQTNLTITLRKTS